MAKLTEKDIQHVAKLAKLELDRKEIVKFRKQLSEVLDYVNKLQQVDTGGIEPLSQTTGLVNVSRTDKISPAASLSVEDALSGTENKYNGYFKVPVILEKNV